MAGPISPGSKPPKLLDRVRTTMRLSRYSPRTEQAYVDWIKRFIRFHPLRHPQEMGADEVKAFLSHLATQMNVVAHRHRTKLFRPCYFYTRRCSTSACLGLTTSFEPNGPAKLPVVFTQAEARAVLSKMHSTPRLMAHLLYGSGLRVMEARTPSDQGCRSWLFTDHPSRCQRRTRPAYDGRGFSG